MGSKTIDDTESDAMKSSTGVQLAPALVVFQMPPPTLPANIVDGDMRLIASARMRPPMLPGPSHRQFCGEMGAGPSVDAGAAAENIAADI